MPSPAPVILFVYNRPEHTRQTVNALRANPLAEKTHLLVYSDAPRSDADADSVASVRKYIKNITGFKNVTVREQASNKGLAASIIAGVTEVINTFGKIIVLEDDMITSPGFLTYMNCALTHFENNDRVWHISGWNYPIPEADLPDVFLWRLMNCWGWGTWESKWKHFQKNPLQLEAEFTPEIRYRFNIDGEHNFFDQIVANNKGTIDTWAIFWYATIFKHHGLCLNPVHTFIQNIGFDGSGVHCGGKDIYGRDLNTRFDLNMACKMEEDVQVVNRIKHFFRTVR